MFSLRGLPKMFRDLIFTYFLRNVIPFVACLKFYRRCFPPSLEVCRKRVPLDFCSSCRRGDLCFYFFCRAGRSSSRENLCSGNRNDSVRSKRDQTVLAANEGLCRPTFSLETTRAVWAGALSRCNTRRPSFQRSGASRNRFKTSKINAVDCSTLWEEFAMNDNILGIDAFLAHRTVDDMMMLLSGA